MSRDGIIGRGLVKKYNLIYIIIICIYYEIVEMLLNLIWEVF